MTKLNNIPVLFNQHEHTYLNTETGAYLKGITSSLLSRLFPNKYSGVPKKYLDAAKNRGSVIHEQIELIDSIGVAPTSEEGRNYIKLKEMYGLKYLESEHTVSDCENYATNIDVIYDVEDNVVDIADFKTTEKLDKEYISWQLSICAYFLELNNPHLRVRNLYGIWLRNDIAELVAVERHPEDEILALIQCDLEGKDYLWQSEYPSYIQENERALYTLGKRIKELTDQYNSIKEEVLAKMVENNDKSFDTGRLLITLVKPSARITFDAKRFESEHSELYSQYLKESKTKETLKLTIR